MHEQEIWKEHQRIRGQTNRKLQTMVQKYVLRNTHVEKGACNSRILLELKIKSPNLKLV